jgi:hypothetical protein
MASPKQKAKPKKGSPRHSSELTVMVSRGMGEIRTFKVSARFLFLSSLFFVFYIIASILVFNKYLDELRARRDQSGELERLEHGIEDAKRDLYRSKQRLAFLKDYFYDLKVGGEGKAESAEPGTVTQEGTTPETTDLSQGSEPAKDAGKERREVLVEIKDLKIKRKGTKLTVSFKLAKAGRGKGALSGYVHIIAMNKGSGPAQFWTYPKVALRNGLPINYKHGEPFRMKHFKTIKGRYFLDSKSRFPSHMKVFVYSQPGKLILQEEFEIPDS